MAKNNGKVGCDAPLDVDHEITSGTDDDFVEGQVQDNGPRLVTP